MYCLSVLYPNRPGARFDLDYYIETHMRLVQDRLGPGGLIRYELASGRSGWPPAAPAPYVMICDMYFPSRDALERAFGAHRDELVADIPVYTNIAPQMYVSEILDAPSGSGAASAPSSHATTRPEI
jgi:uncharacterized protein (TIGR02118 family)